MIIPIQVIKAIGALSENGTVCIDGTDRDLFRTVAVRALSENLEAHECELPGWAVEYEEPHRG